MWRFRPVDFFELDRTRRAYRSFQWTLVLAAPVLSVMTWWVYVYPQHPTALTTLPGYVAIGLQATISALMYGSWIVNGIDLRSSWGQVGVLLASIVLAPIAFTMVEAPAAIPAGLVAAFLFASSLIVSIGPSWSGIIPVGTALAYTLIADIPNPLYFSFIVYAIALWITFKSSIWYLDILSTMEEAATARTTMRLAEERLRFAADLHDIMGQRLAAISLQAQTARQLAHQGADPSSPLNAIVDLTDRSTADMRAMVSTYQVPEWDIELPGAISLLKAAGARITVTGKAPESRETEAAYIIRESTTNILKHSNATKVTVKLNESGMTVTNNGAQTSGADQEWTGLAALERRIYPATLSAKTVGDTFVLSAQWNHD